MLNRAVICASAALAIILTAASSGDAQPSPRRTTYLTFNRAVGLPGVTLAPGSYVFELGAPSSSLDVVQVTSGDRRRLYYLGFTRPIARPGNLRDSAVVFGEALEGAPPPIAVWYPPDMSYGRKFVYPR
jgi:hypothetical protein